MKFAQIWKTRRFVVLTAILLGLLSIPVYLANTSVNVTKVKTAARARKLLTTYEDGMQTFAAGESKYLSFKDGDASLQVDYPEIIRWGKYYLLDNDGDGWVDVALCSQPPGMHKNLGFYANRQTGQGAIWLSAWQLRYRLSTMF